MLRNFRVHISITLFFISLFSGLLFAQPTDSIDSIARNSIVSKEQVTASTDSSQSNDSLAKAAVTSKTEKAKEKTPPTFLESFNNFAFGILFHDIAFGSINIDETSRDGQIVLDKQGNAKQKNISLPFIVIWLLFGALIFSFLFRFINLRGFWHAIQITRGKFDKEHHKGDISHFKALTSALSATVGLGNIAGVAIAISVGGPGAVFWMMVTAFFGMTSKFTSSTLSQLYRKTNADGTVSGGPMYYLDIGLREKGMPVFGKILGVGFAIALLFAALGGGNMFQANQTVAAFVGTFDLGPHAKWAIGTLLAIGVGAVILGGIKSIGNTTSRIVPFMVFLYVLASLTIIGVEWRRVPEGIALIVSMAFTKNAFFGGILGVMVQGIKRAAFSSEAGLGSSAIIHAAAKTDEPVREGLVAMLEPFVDTIVVCLMTSLVVILTGAWNDPDLIAQHANGVTLTTAAFKTAIPWFPYILTISIGLFAYSTMISWCYYGERGWIYLLDHFGEGVGLKTVVIFKIVFVAAIILGSVESLTNVLNFSDVMILSIAFPNILGGLILWPKVRSELDRYWKKIQN